MTTTIDLNTTEEAAAFFRAEHAGHNDWTALCLKLQRTARGIPAVFPSALAAAEATPEEDRVYKKENLRRGMVAYFDDPNDGNPFGHICFVAGRSKTDSLYTWTNDAMRRGGVDIVPFEFYLANWGDSFQFGATSLNGFDFKKPEVPAIPKHAHLGDNFKHAIQDLEAAVVFHEKKGHDALARKLKADLENMKKTARKYK